MNNLSGTYCFSHRSFSTTKLPLRKSICSRKSYPYLKQVIYFIFHNDKFPEIHRQKGIAISKSEFPAAGNDRDGKVLRGKTGYKFQPIVTH